MANVTANYGWVKPVVGGDDDAWGGELNNDLDGIDSVVHGLQSSKYDAANPSGYQTAANVTASLAPYYLASNPSGYQTAAQVTTSLAPYALTASVPAASSTTPLMDGTAAVGAGTTWARADHVHPSDTSRYAASNPSSYQTAAQVTASLAPYAPLASPAFTGTPSLPTGTTGVTQAAGDSSTKLATTAFVSALPVAMGDNRIINGDFRIDQRNGGASGTATNAYTVDRWFWAAGQTGKATWGQNAGAVAPPYSLGFGYYFSVTSSSAYALVAGDSFQFRTVLEGDAVTDFAWGTAAAQPVTLSFLAYSNQAGTFSGSIRNYAATRSYPFTFVLTANTWTKIAITVPGDTAGTWVMSTNAGALYLTFDLGSGTSYRGPANAWASANYAGATGAVSVVATNAATFYVTGVKLEVGSVATPFNRQSLAKSLADCQRYYQVFPGMQVSGYASASGPATVHSTTWPPMRATPTVTQSGQTFGNGSSLVFTPVSNASSSTYIVAVAAGPIYCTFNLALSAEL